jgi:hypothetical protein
MRGLTPAQLKAGGLTISNDGDAAIDAVVSVIGAALTPEPAVSKGFTIERQAYTLDGKIVDLKSLSGGKSDVTQNDRFVIALKVTSNEAGGRVLLVDRLPAGFEIENPRLVESGRLLIEWLKATQPSTASSATTGLWRHSLSGQRISAMATRRVTRGASARRRRPAQHQRSRNGGREASCRAGNRCLHRPRVRRHLRASGRDRRRYVSPERYCAHGGWNNDRRP